MLSTDPISVGATGSESTAGAVRATRNEPRQSERTRDTAGHRSTSMDGATDRGPRAWLDPAYEVVETGLEVTAYLMVD